MGTRALCKTRFERRLFTIKDSTFTLDLTIRAFNKYRIRAATIYWRYRFRQHAAVCSLPALDQPRDHWRPENFVSPGIHDTSMDSPRLLRAALRLLALDPRPKQAILLPNTRSDWRVMISEDDDRRG